MTMTPPNDLRFILRALKLPDAEEALVALRPRVAQMTKSLKHLSDVADYFQEVVSYERLSHEVMKLASQGKIVEAEQVLEKIEDACAKGIFNPFKRFPEDPE